MSRPLADQVARDRIAQDLDATLVVEAAAGTGKTTALIGRILACIRTGRGRLDQMVAVTFTEKAAGELKLRLRSEIDAARAGTGLPDAERRRFDDALAQLEVARIATIHSFCADLLRERPVEAAIDPAFRVLPDEESAALLETAFERWFHEILEGPPEGIRRFLCRRAWKGSRGPRDALVGACRALVEHRDHPTPWSRPPYDRAHDIDALVDEISALGHLSQAPSVPGDELTKSLRPLAEFTARIMVRESDAARDLNRIEADLVQLRSDLRWVRKGRTRYFADGILRADVLSRWEALEEQLSEFLQNTDADLAALLFQELRPVIVGYEELKQRHGYVDFLDLLLMARNLVRNDRSVREHLQQRFTHVFVDEFQDTDPLQAEILLLLAAEDPQQAELSSVRPVAGKLFVVGDPKQAIYRFRRADVALYQRIKEQLVATGAEILYLTTSFRSVPGIQAAVNQSFATVMPGHCPDAQADYVALEGYRDGLESQPAVVALPIPAPYNPYGRVTKRAVAESTPDAVAAFVDWLITESGWTVHDPSTGGAIPVSSEHVCLLFRQFVNWRDDVTRSYVRALEARRVPHVLVGGRSFHEREEVMALRAALNAIERPDDELHVYATLRGPYVALHDEALFLFREDVGHIHPLRQASDEQRLAHSEVFDALELLRALHEQRNRRPIADTIAAFLDATRAHAGIAIWPTGEQALANVLRALEEARRFEARTATSFRGFVEWFDERAKRGEGAQAPVVEEGSEGVRIMTAHRAKGLEFPIVVLCDPGCSRSKSKPSRFVDTDRRLWAFPLVGCVPSELREHAREVLEADNAEEVRVGYVAATRARDLLVVPACGDEQVGGWADVLHASLYPVKDARRSGTPAQGCPAFGADTVLDRPPDAPPGPDASVAPGCHTIGECSVVWWDPALLKLERPVLGGVRQQELLVADDELGFDKQGIIAFETWRTAKESALAAGRIVTDRHTKVTSRALRQNVDTSSIAVESTEAASQPRPGGRRFGILVHAALADVPLDAASDAIEKHVKLHARLTGASDEEHRAALDAVTSALSHPLLRRAAASAKVGKCFRELPLSSLEGDEVIEGVADIVWFDDADDGEAWTVVDFKTDARPGHRAPYLAQVELYRQLVERATGQRASGVLLVV